MGWLELSWRNRTYRPDPTTAFTIGREGDLRVTASMAMHSRMLELFYTDLNWWIANIGRQLDCYLYPDGGGQVHLPAGAKHPLMWPRTLITVWVSAERINIEARVSDTLLPAASSRSVEGSTRFYKPTPRERVALAAISETLLRSPGAPVVVPLRADAAKRAGLTLKNFDHAIDAACEKLGQLGWSDMTGPNRITTLAQFVVDKRIVTDGDLNRLFGPVP